MLNTLIKAAAIKGNWTLQQSGQQFHVCQVAIVISSKTVIDMLMN
jgi:hypothetical protein